MKKIIYLIRHSGPFISYYNEENMLWDEFNKNMILSCKGEQNAEKLCTVEELKNIVNIYSSNSARAIGTAKYLSESNNVKIKIDNRINERNIGIEKISDLPQNFIYDQFLNKNLKYKNGESLNDVSLRFDSFINEILNNGSDKNILVTHGIVLMNYLNNFCDVKIKNDNFKVIYKDKIIFDNKLKSPDLFKIEFTQNNIVISVEHICF